MKKNNFKPLIKKIWQKDASVFSIEWTDGKIGSYSLEKLQAKCPCARCANEDTLEPINHVSALRIKSVGRYALKVTFTKGCSMGIYDFEMLYRMAEEENACV